MDKSIEQLPDTFENWFFNNYSLKEIRGIRDTGSYKKRGMATDSEISQLYERYGDEILSQINENGGLADYFDGVETNLPTRRAFEGCLIWRAALATAQEFCRVNYNRAETGERLFECKTDRAKDRPKIIHWHMASRGDAHAKDISAEYMKSVSLDGETNFIVTIQETNKNGVAIGTARKMLVNRYVDISYSCDLMETEKTNDLL